MVDGMFCLLVTKQVGFGRYKFCSSRTRRTEKSHLCQDASGSVPKERGWETGLEERAREGSVIRGDSEKWLRFSCWFPLEAASKQGAPLKKRLEPPKKRTPVQLGTSRLGFGPRPRCRPCHLLKDTVPDPKDQQPNTT